jgi:hypothetical protein
LIRFKSYQAMYDAASTPADKQLAKRRLDTAEKLLKDVNEANSHLVEDAGKLGTLTIATKVALYSLKRGPLNTVKLRTYQNALTAQKALEAKLAIDRAFLLKLLNIDTTRTPIISAFDRYVNTYSISGGPSLTQGTNTYTSMEPDPYYMQGPGCVICNDAPGRINRALSGGWLHWRALPGAPPTHKPDNYKPETDVFLGIHGHYAFFVKSRDNLKNVPKFAMLILAAATQSDTGNAGGAGGTTSASNTGTTGGGKGLFSAPLAVNPSTGEVQVIVP